MKTSTIPLFTIPLVMLWTAAASAAGLAHYGAREHVRILGDQPIEVTALLDVKARHSVLKVTSLKYVLHDNGPWVRFGVDSGDVVTLQQVRLDQPILHDHVVHIRGGGVRHEPVVALNICVGNQRLSVPFTLKIRQNYTPPMVLGAAQIAQLGTVDADAKFLHEPGCSNNNSAPATSHTQ